MEVEIHSSDLDDFNEVVLSEVKKWRFTPPTVNGRPVKAQALFPIPIKIKDS